LATIACAFETSFQSMCRGLDMLRLYHC
jgi:hypothetical protein